MASKMSREDLNSAGSVIQWPPGSGSGSVFQDCGSADIDPIEILTDSQNWKKLTKNDMFFIQVMSEGRKYVQ